MTLKGYLPRDIMSLSPSPTESVPRASIVTEKDGIFQKKWPAVAFQSDGALGSSDDLVGRVVFGPMPVAVSRSIEWKCGPAKQASSWP